MPEDDFGDVDSRPAHQRGWFEYAKMGGDSVSKLFPANAADEAWQELVRLRRRAIELGIDLSDVWPINRLREEIAKAEAADE